MVHVETVDLSARGVELPSDRVGMVIAQPYLSLTAAEPYQCTAETKPQQLQMLTDTLKVSRAVQHGAPKTHFTIFPEYSIPGTDGIALVETALRADDWPTGTIVIGGTDALSKPEFVTLAGAPGPDGSLEVLSGRRHSWYYLEARSNSAMRRISKVKVLPGYRLELEFEDGVSGTVDVSENVGKGVFALWLDPLAFDRVRIGSSGELVWDDRIDLCPDALYLKVTGKKPEDIFPALRDQPPHA